MNYQNNNHLNR